MLRWRRVSRTTSPDLVIFDCDGVLVDSERLINRIESQLVARLGLAWTPAETRERFKGHTVSEIVAILEATIQQAVPAG